MGFGSNPNNNGVRISGTEQVRRLFLDLPDAVDKRVLRQLVARAERTIAEIERSEAPQDSGLLRQALGGSKIHVYGSRLFATVGVRRGFRKEVAATKGGGVKMVGKRLAPQVQPASGNPVRNPTKYLHLVTGGRNPIEPARGRVLHSVNGRFFTRAAAAKANPFMDRAFTRAQAVVAGELATGAEQIIAEAAAILKT